MYNRTLKSIIADIFKKAMCRLTSVQSQKAKSTQEHLQ